MSVIGGPSSTTLSNRLFALRPEGSHPSIVAMKSKTRAAMKSPGSLRQSIAVAAAASALMLFVVGAGTAVELGQQQQESETLSNVPQLLSGSDCSSEPSECKKTRIQRPKSKKAEFCTIKCVNTCIRGGLGSPGEGPLNVRRPLVVFKQGFRSRQYCLVECSDICNLIGDGDDGP